MPTSVSSTLTAVQAGQTPRSSSAAIEHERRRAPVRRVAGADQAVRLKALARRDRRDLGHDVAGVAGGRADLDAVGAQRLGHLGRAVDQRGVSRRDRDLLRGTKMS